MSATISAIDGVPLREVAPVRSPNEIGEWVRRARSEGFALFPLGGGTMTHVGQPPIRSGVGIDLTPLHQVIDYPARDMTITVQAGIRLRRLREILRAERQRLPIDIPYPDRATLGGSIAVNLSGPRRYGFGTFRDYVIGLHFIDDLGHEVRGGGRVVKNVAGYDLCKLHTGALGTLGIITQVTLKLRPIPEKQASMTWTCSVTELGPILDRLHHSATRPAYVEALGSDDRCELTVGFEECAAAVDWQIEQWHREFPCTNVTIREGDDAESHLQRAIDKLHSDGAWLWKASVRPSGVTDFICNLPRGRFRWQAHTLSGIVWGQGRLDEEVSAVAHDLNLLQEQAARHSGSVIVWRCPVEWKAVLALWGRPRNDWELMRAIKRHMDPCGLFNPGRFVVS